MAVIRPLGTSKVMSSRTVCEPNDLVTPRSEMMGSPGSDPWLSREWCPGDQYPCVKKLRPSTGVCSRLALAEKRVQVTVLVSPPRRLGVVVVVVDVDVVPAGVVDVVVGASPMTESTLPKPRLEARLSTSMMSPLATVVSPPVTGARPDGKGSLIHRVRRLV